MKFSARESKALKKIAQEIVMSFLVTVVLVGVGHAAQGQYAGNGISFSYPDKYKLTTSTKKSGETVLLKNGSDSISIQIMTNVLIDGFDDLVINKIDKDFKEKGYAVSDVSKENKQIPLKVKGEDVPVNVDAVKFNHLVKIVQNDMTINLKQTMFFYSYGEHGYMINYTRINGKYSDLVDVMSSFSFDEKEVVESDAKKSVY